MKKTSILGLGVLLILVGEGLLLGYYWGPLGPTLGGTALLAALWAIMLAPDGRTPGDDATLEEDLLAWSLGCVLATLMWIVACVCGAALASGGGC